MSKVYFISDLHLGHKNILNFARPEFSSLDEMHNCIIESWNKVVTKRDVVFVLGDVCFDHRYLPLLDKLLGMKRLILGNHDKFKHGELFKYFHTVHGALSYKQNMLTHIPIHPDEFYRWRYNIHGHLHAYNLKDPRYINVNIDMMRGYTPVPFDTLIKEREKEIAYGTI